MNNNTTGGDLSDKSSIDEISKLNYTLNDLDRISGLLFTAGLGVFFHQTDLTEESIYLTQTGEASVEENTQLNYTIAREIIEMTKINLSASLISLYTTSARLKQLEDIVAEKPTPSAEERLKGREIVTFANMLNALSFTMAINGYELIANGILHQQRETPPP